MIREFFYLQKSDRKVILALLVVITVALGIIFLTGGENDTSNALTPADTLKKDTFRRRRRSSIVIVLAIVAVGHQPVLHQNLATPLFLAIL